MRNKKVSLFVCPLKTESYGLAGASINEPNKCRFLGCSVVVTNLGANYAAITPNIAYYRLLTPINGLFPEKKIVYFPEKREAGGAGKLTVAARLTPLQTKCRPMPAKK
jgi:hypothetical protein